MHYFSFRRAVIFLTLAVGFFSVCSTNHNKEKEKGGIPIVVSILPQKYFVEKVGGDFVDVSVMVEPGSSPHLYEPKPSRIAALTNAKLYFSIGVEFEKAWIPRFKEVAPGLVVVPLDSGITRIPMAYSFQEHSGGVGEDLRADDGARAPDPHIWLSPELVKNMVKIITGHLCRIDPAHALEYRKNGDYFLMRIQELQDSIRIYLQESNVTKFIVFHPSWGYFAEEFGMWQIPIEIEGREPSPKQLQHVIDFAKKNNITTIFVQPQFSRKTAETIASQINGTVVPIDPLAYNWDTNLLAVANALVGR